MLVSHRHKFIYTKTVKTAGTSVESYFERFCMPAGAWSQSHLRDEHVSEAGIVGVRAAIPPAGCRYWNHMPAKLIRERVGEVWNQYFKFCVVRNPYDKVTSAFYYFQRLEKRPFTSIADEQARLERWLLSSAHVLPIDRDKYLIDEKFCLDSVLRYETLTADLETLCGKLGLPYDPSWLPRFKTGTRPPHGITRDLYTAKSKEIVAAAFSFELEYFGYSFPGDA
jgi:hypothetical protein